MKTDYIIFAGEPLSLALISLEGDITSVSSVQAVLKVAGPNGTVPPMSQPSVATFTVSAATAPDLGWQLYIDDSVTMNLKPGIYITNARLNLISGEGPLKTDPITIEIKGSVS